MEGINVCCMTMLPDFYATLRQRRNRAIDVVSVPRRCPADFGWDGVDSAPFPRRGGGPFAYGTVANERYEFVCGRRDRRHLLGSCQNTISRFTINNIYIKGDDFNFQRALQEQSLMYRNSVEMTENTRYGYREYQYKSFRQQRY